MRRPPVPDAPALETLLTRARLAHESISGVDSAAALARALEAGDALIAVKARVPHGAWSRTLAKTGIPPSTARLYMQLARERARIVAAGCTSIREARRLLAGTKPRARTATGRRGRERPVQDRYDEGYADGYRAGRADGYAAGEADGYADGYTSRGTDNQTQHGPSAPPLDRKDLRWLITLAHPDKHAGNLRATRVTQWLNEIVARGRTAA